MEKKLYSYLALGDSYTIGEQVPEKENFPNQLVSILYEKGYDFKKPRIIAQTGWTTDELQSAIKKADLHPPYDFVTLLIGVNNQYRGRKVEDYIPEFDSLLKQAVEFAGNQKDHVFILSIPDWGVTPFANGRDKQQIAREIDEYNNAAEKIAGGQQVYYINITPGTRDASKDHSLLASDRLHPSGKEYAKWAEKTAELIQRKLKN